MVDDVVTARYETPFKEVVRLLDEHRISGLPVVDVDGKVLGVVSETDLMLRQSRDPQTSYSWTGRLRLLGSTARRVAAKSRAGTAGGVMSTPAVTVRDDATVAEAARLMAKRRIERLPVVDHEDRLVGIVTRRDLLQVFLRADDDIRQAVQQEVFLDTLWLPPHVVEATVQDGVVTLTGQLERRSDIPVAVRMTRGLDGVVDVVDHLSYRIDDSHLQPAEQTVHGITDDWLRKL
nr:CBS domain-containing protein [Streptomyces sp. 142MFCol3.1]